MKSVLVLYIINVSVIATKKKKKKIDTVLIDKSK